MKQFLTPALVVIAIGLAFFGGSMWQKVQNLEKAKTAGTTAEAVQPVRKPLSLDAVKSAFDKSFIKFGDTAKKVIFVEIADPSCPFCQVVAGKNPQLNRQIDTTKNTFKLVSDGGAYVAPLVEIKKLIEAGKASYSLIYAPGHGNGEMGMKALYCAFEKGKYWEVHDKIMTSAGYDLMNEKIQNDTAKAGDLAAFLKAIVDPAEMENCVKDPKWDDRLSNDQKLAGEISSGGTPFFLVNTKEFPGAYNFKEMEAVVASALK